VQIAEAGVTGWCGRSSDHTTRTAKTSPPEYGSQFSFAVPEITNELLKGIQAAGSFH
jgi:hypothetical protein